MRRVVGSRLEMLLAGAGMRLVTTAPTSTSPELPSPAYRLAITTASGFTERAGERTGMQMIHWALRDRYARRPEHWISHHAWHEDATSVAEQIELGAHRDRLVTICVGYSWGAGRFARRFARALEDRGRTLDLLLLIDPVPCSWGLLRKLVAITRLGTYSVPGNVGQVRTWRQVNKRAWWDPVGRPLRLEDSAATEFAGETVLGERSNLVRHATQSRWAPQTYEVARPHIHHGSIDNDLIVRGAVLRAIDEYVSQTGADDDA